MVEAMWGCVGDAHAAHRGRHFAERLQAFKQRPDFFVTRLLSVNRILEYGRMRSCPGVLQAMPGWCVPGLSRVRWQGRVETKVASSVGAALRANLVWLNSMIKEVESVQGR